LHISVIIPTYNRYELLKRALNSVFSQTYTPFEVIVIDDGSTDETQQIVQDFPNIKYFYQENRGVSSARNLGIEKSASDWIAFLDSDDEWHENKLEEQVFFHKQNPKVLMSYTDEKWIRESVEVKVPKKFRKFGGDIFNECLSHCIIAPSATLIHKDLLNAVGDFDESLEVCEDYDLWLRIAQSYKIGLVDKKLITKYAGHEDQLSFKHWGMDRFRVIALEKLLKYEFQSKTLELGEKSISLPSFTWECIEKGILETLEKKYTTLLKGAIKYDKIADIKIYEKRLRELNE